MRRRSSMKQSGHTAAMKRKIRRSDSENLELQPRGRRNSGHYTPEEASPVNSKPSSPIRKNSLSTLKRTGN